MACPIRGVGHFWEIGSASTDFERRCTLVCECRHGGRARSSTHLYQPESDFILNSYLCISSDTAWIEWYRRSWREENPPERHSTSKIKLRDVMPIDFLDGEEDRVLPPACRLSHEFDPLFRFRRIRPHCKKIFSINTINATRWYNAKRKSGANLAETQQSQ